MGSINQKKKLIFCTGSGRCGTSSLSFLLKSQESAFVSHELFPILPWLQDFKMSNRPAELLQFRLFQMTHQSHNYDIVGDSGSYYLPYIKFIIEAFEDNNNFDLKIIVLKRDMKNTVDSFKTKFTRQNNNPLQNHNGAKNEWDDSFPKYSNFWTLGEAIEKYYIDFYKAAEEIALEHPGIVKIFNTEVLNSESGLSQLFKHLNIKNPKIIKNVRKNIG
jgi:hypothetical protein